jgi:drug/metabolite transporter (DMT)-like permease
MSSIALPARTAAHESGRTLAGVLFALVTVVIWAVWIVTTRQAVGEHLPVAWLGIFRFAVPAIVLLPFWWRGGLWPRGVDKRLLALMVLGAGAPFFLIVSTGMAFAPAASIGVLLGGTMPFFVALIAGLIYRERFNPARLAGFAAILAALFLIGGRPLLAGEGAGQLLIPLAAFLWAIYTHAVKRSGMKAVAAAGIIGAWSTLLLLPFAIVEGATAIVAAGPAMIAGQILSQGILSGVVALIAYGAAVARLGASRAAVFTALPPALAAMLAIPVLGEIPSPVMWVGVVLAVGGVALASGALPLPKRKAA